MQALRIQNLYYNYPGGVQALKGIDFTVINGESVALVGANSAGKSTLLMHCNGCLLAEKGSVTVAGIPVDMENLCAVRQKVGTVFQEADDQLFMPSIEEDVAFGPMNMGLEQDEVNARVEEALNAVGALHLRQRFPHHLSGGEKRATAIATVLAMRPEILLLDEPTSNLDPRARRRFIQLIRTLPQTKVLATHDLDMVLELCPRTVILHEGRIYADGPTRDLFSQVDLLERCGLEQPLCMQGMPA